MSNNINEISEKYVFINTKKYNSYKKKFKVDDDKIDEIEYLEIEIELFIEERLKKKSYDSLKFLLENKCFKKFIKEYKLKPLLNPKERCSICLEDLDEKKNLCKLECKHQFHFDCIMNLYKSQGGFSNKCPECRRQFAEANNIVNQRATMDRIHTMSLELSIAGNPTATLIHDITHLDRGSLALVTDIVQDMSIQYHEPAFQEPAPPRRQRRRRRINPDEYEYLEPGY